MLTKNKVIFGIVGFIIFVLVFAVFLYVLFPGNTNTMPNTPTPSVSGSSLELLNILPVEDISKTYLPVNQVDFTFNQPMNSQTFYIEVTPFVETYISQRPSDPNTLILSPKVIWKEGVTTIKVLSTTKSLNGVSLGKDLEYKINIHDLVYPSNVDTHGI